jgi:hypothetical protein
VGTHGQNADREDRGSDNYQQDVAFKRHAGNPTNCANATEKTFLCVLGVDRAARYPIDVRRRTTAAVASE